MVATGGKPHSDRLRSRSRRKGPPTIRLKFGDMAGAKEFAPKQRYSARVEECRRYLVEMAASVEDAALLAKHLAGYTYNR